MLIRGAVVAICAGLAGLQGTTQAVALQGRNSIAISASRAATDRPVNRLESTGVPEERQRVLFFTGRLANEKQASIYMRPAPFEVAGGARVHPGDVRLIDARSVSADASGLNIAAISEDGNLLVYGVRHGGEDEEQIYFFNVPKRKNTTDTLPRARYNGFGLKSDGRTLFYAKALADGSGAVFSHAMGTSADKDQEIFGGTYRGETLGPDDRLGCRVSDNGHWLIVTVSRGAPVTRNDILVKDLRKPNAPFEPLVYGVDARFDLHMAGDRMFVRTNYGAPRERVLRASLGDPSTKSWPVVIPEGRSDVGKMLTAGGVIVVNRRTGSNTETDLYSFNGREIGAIRYPAPGRVSALSGSDRSNVIYYALASPNSPPTIYSYDVRGGQSFVWPQPTAR
jgi:prolyl oligopeptidase